MKKGISLLVALMLLCLSGSALAMPIRLTNGTAAVTGRGLGEEGTEAELELQSFHLLGLNEEGSYLIFDGEALYTVDAEALNDMVIGLADAEVPALGELESLSRGAKGEEVMPLQEGLKALGYLTGAVDGDFGGGTETAVKAFQAANGLEETGVADELTQLLVASLSAKTTRFEVNVDPEIMFEPILGRTSVDLAPLMASGLVLEYDDIDGEGFISDGAVVRYDASGASDLDKFVLGFRFGLLAREDAEGNVDLLPAMKLSCTCVRRPVATEVTFKSGSVRGTAPVEDLQVSLDGVDTVEEGVVLLTDRMTEALANAAEAGELKMRIEGQYNTFDVELEKDSLDAIARIGKVALELGE